MNRSAKGFRVVSSLFTLLNIAVFFLPVTRRVQENYAALSWQQSAYIKDMFGGGVPFGDGTTVGIEPLQMMCIICFMILPVILSVVAGIWGIVGNYRQMVSSILIYIILALYTGMYFSISAVWPDALDGQIYERGIACSLHLICSVCGALSATAALLCTPKKIEDVKVDIPQIREIKQQQIEAKYNIIMETSKKEEVPEYQPGKPRGVMVGLSGLYKGAEIPFTGGEYIKLGRQSDNHLVFEGQPNVSRSHCQIKWDVGRGKYLFRDYSSNGSFVNGSKDCLPQNLEIEMEPGTVVAIGDETNTFRLE
ncbi:MAG: FHA domain-containing protein [Dorea sp.]|nr:FHA domain-containing protein [Dorea sp.]